MVFHSSYCRKMTMETALTIGNGIESFLGAEDIHVTMTDKETHCHGILMNIERQSAVCRHGGYTLSS